MHNVNKFVKKNKQDIDETQHQTEIEQKSIKQETVYEMLRKYTFVCIIIFSTRFLYSNFKKR